MELRTENCRENCSHCCSKSAVCCDSESTSCCHLPSSSAEPPQYCSHPCHHMARENTSSDSDQVNKPAMCRNNNDSSDSERQSGVTHNVSSDLNQSSRISDSRVRIADGNSAPLVATQLNNDCDRSLCQLKRKINNKRRTLIRPLRRNSIVTGKHHLNSIAMRYRGSSFKRSLCSRKVMSLDKCADSRLSSYSLIDRIRSAESLTKCRSFDKIHRTERASSLTDLGRSSNSTCYSEGATPLLASQNDSAMPCNKDHTFISMHSLHTDKEFESNPALRPSAVSPSMPKNRQQDVLDIATVRHATSGLLTSRRSSSTTRLEEGHCNRTIPGNFHSFEGLDRCKNLALKRETVRKSRGCGRRKLRRRRREYGRLRDMVPSCKALPVVSKVTLIEEAVKYIEELHGALIQRFRDRGLPPTLAGSGLDRSDVSEGNIRELVVQLLTEYNPGCLPPTRLENNRTKLKLQVSRPKLFDRRS